MIIGIIKSLLYMFIFYIFLRIANFFFKFIYFLFYKDEKKNIINKDNDALKMLQCEKCKIYITKTDAHITDGKIFCKDHKD